MSQLVRRGLLAATLTTGLATSLGATTAAHAVPPLGEEGAGVDGCLASFTASGVVTGGPFVVPGAVEITYSCVVYGLDGSSQTVSQTLPGSVGLVAGEYALGANVRQVCATITWTALSGRSYTHTGICLA